MKPFNKERPEDSSFEELMNHFKETLKEADRVLITISKTLPEVMESEVVDESDKKHFQTFCKRLAEAMEKSVNKLKTAVKESEK